AELLAALQARGIQMTGQPIGNAHLTANSQGDLLRAHIESDFANSAIKGDGEWRLTGDYPGSAAVTFSKLDFAELREWISPSKDSGEMIAGSAEGELRLEGPARKPELLKASLRIPKLELGPAPNSQITATRGALVLHNEGPIVVSMPNQVVTVERVP